MSVETVTRRRFFAFLTAASMLLAYGSLLMGHASAEAANDEAALKKRFELLSQNTNVECSAKFEASIDTMSPDARLQGSCCAPMDEARYRQQIDGLRNYSEIIEVPPDPYDISASLAHKLMGYYDLVLSKEEQGASTRPNRVYFPWPWSMSSLKHSFFMGTPQIGSIFFASHSGAQDTPASARL